MRPRRGQRGCTAVVAACCAEAHPRLFVPVAPHRRIARQATWQEPGRMPSVHPGPQDAELVAFGVGQHDPALLALADVDPAGAELQEAPHLLLLLAADRVDVD